MQKNPLFDKEDERVDAVYRVVKGRINLQNIVPTCIEVAMEIEGISGLKGSEKLDLLQKVIKYAIRDSNKSREAKEELIHTVETIVPLVVQAAILASKSPIVAHVQAVCVGCWTKVKKS